MKQYTRASHACRSAIPGVSQASDQEGNAGARRDWAPVRLSGAVMALTLACILGSTSIQATEASASEGNGLEAICGDRSTGSYSVRVRNQSANSWKAVFTVPETKTETTAVIPAKEDTFVLIPGSFGNRIEMRTDHGFRDSIEAGTSECYGRVTVTSRLVGAVRLAPSGGRSVQFRRRGDEAVTTLTVPNNESASIKLPAELPQGSNPIGSAPQTESLYDVSEPDLQGAESSSLSPSTVQLKPGDDTEPVRVTLVNEYRVAVGLATSKPNGALLREPVTLTASVDPRNAAGSVTFADGSTTLGTCRLTDGKCSVSAAFTKSGQRSISAVYSDGSDYRSPAASLSQTVVPISAVAPKLDSGSANVGKSTTIKSSGYALLDVYGPVPSPTFQWQRCTVLGNPLSCSDITADSGATGAWWGTRDNDIGRQLRVKVSWATVEGILSVFSPLSGLVDPVVLRSPVLSPSAPRRGVAVTSSFGVWNGYVAGESNVLFQWQRCTSSTDQTTCVNTGAVGQRYAPTAADLGFYLRMAATLTTRGRSVRAHSAITTKVVRS
jgi:hypothetical protein